MLPSHRGILRDQSSESQPAGHVARPRLILAEPDKRPRRYRIVVRRRLLAVAIFLLAGAVVNVAVAWGCARFVRVLSSSDAVTLTTSEIEAVVALKPTPPNAVRRLVYRGRIEGARAQRFGGFGVTIDSTDVVHSWSSDIEATWSPLGIDDVQWAGARRRIRAEVLRVGWPVRCLRKYDLVSELAIILRRVRANLPTPPARPLRPICFRPIWPGFAINTLFYAGIHWLLIPGPFALRRLIRQRRGLCPKCAYPTGESAVCTECGRDLPKRVRPATSGGPSAEASG